MLFFDVGFDDGDVGEWGVGGVGRDGLDGFDDIKAGAHFAEDGELAVEVWAAGCGLVGLADFVGEFYGAVGFAVEALLGAVERSVIEGLAPFDVELLGVAQEVFA